MTPTIEDYLKTVVQLGGKERLVTNKEISERLDVKAASVTEMVNKLVKAGLVTYQPYYGVQVTKRGYIEANKLIRKHRLWEVFLIDYLNYNCDEVHEEAERLEHVTSEKLSERLAQLLDNPTHDPHGEQIPASDGSLDYLDFLKLSDLKAPNHFLIKEVSDDHSFLEKFKEKDLKLNAKYQLIKIDDSDQSMTIQTQSKELIDLSAEASEKLLIQKTPS